MRKYIITVIALLFVIFLGLLGYYRFGFYVALPFESQDIVFFTKTEGKEILVDQGNGFEPFEVKGVDMGVGIPGHFATDYAVDKQTYLRWFREIQDMGANTIRVYTILHNAFYDAVYEYNKNNDHPLYIIHGLWVDDYTLNSHEDGYDAGFLQELLDNSKTLVDILHGRRMVSLGEVSGSGIYTKDISPWVIGYILGVEWEDSTVAYTDHAKRENHSYQGEYLYTTDDATPFEAMLAQVGDQIIAYETRRYHQQRLVAFANWPTTDPLQYPEELKRLFQKIACVDVEHIRLTDAMKSGTFASYHIYPYYPDYLSYYSRIGKKIPGINEKDYTDKDGNVNYYLMYLTVINQHHSIPVIISEFGVPSSRGMAQRDNNTARAQGYMSETDQTWALEACYRDIKQSGCAGSCIFTWQDEWFKRTWNTMNDVDLTKTPYWSDYQTNEQYFGLLSFDPGTEQSVCYVDGDLSEWSPDDVITTKGRMQISMKYDEKFLYFLVKTNAANAENGTWYIPIDTTPKSGSSYCSKYDLNFERDADFLMVISGKKNSRVLVQERYDVFHAMNWEVMEQEDPYCNPPAKDSSTFTPINLILQMGKELKLESEKQHAAKIQPDYYETGKLTYGNANPQSKDYNSLADYCFRGDSIEIKLPWQLLNFSNPSEMQIHDDYYEKYGVENQGIEALYTGVGDGTGMIAMKPVALEGWGNVVTYHERLKPGYYAMQKLWANGGGM